MLQVEGVAIAEGLPQTSRREEAKGERRSRIVEATCDLLREVGIEELSMKMVSARAGVSLSTVYNLFGSKQAVLAGVFDSDLATFEALVAKAPSKDALERIIDAVDIAADLYGADPSFYRATMWRRIGSPGDVSLSAALREPRIRFWRGMIEDAVRAGHLRPSLDPAVLGALVVQICSAVLADWISGDITVDRLRLETKFGVSVALAPFAARAESARLRTLTATLHRDLSRVHR